MQVGCMLEVMDHSKWMLPEGLSIYNLPWDPTRMGTKELGRELRQAGGLSMNSQIQVLCPLLITTLVLLITTLEGNCYFV